MLDWESFRPYARAGQDGPLCPASLAVIIPPVQPLQAGLEFAAAFREQEVSLWIFGHGLSLPGRAPDWCLAANVTLVELGALYPADEIEATSDFRQHLLSWFKQLQPGPEHKVLLSCAYTRFLYFAMESVPLLQAINRLASSTRVISSDPGWKASPQNQERHRLSGRQFLKLVLWTWAGLLLALAVVAREAFERRKLLTDLKRRRAQPHPRPDFWLTVHHEWFRFNPHLIESFGLTCLQQSKVPGILFQGELLPGERDHFTLKRKGAQFYAGLGPLLPQLGRLPLDQLVVPETLGGWVRAVTATGLSSMALLFRLARAGGPQTAFRPDLVSAWARLLSVDLLRAKLAEQATRAALGRSLEPSSVVINYGSQSAAPVAADLCIQHAGHKTVDFCHGAGIEVQIPLYHTSSSLATTWTEVDAQVLARLGQPAIAAGMPVRGRPQPRSKNGTSLRLLLASNYSHRDTVVNGFFPMSQFHHYLAGLCDLLEQARPGQFSFRWRPHPADSPEEIAQALKRSQTTIQPSCGSLGEDLDWCDLIVTSMSSLLFEALLWSKPIFVHILPRFRATLYARSLASQRRFFYLPEVVEQIIVQFGPESPGDGPEEQMRKTFFGQSGWPAGPEALWERLRC